MFGRKWRESVRETENNVNTLMKKFSSMKVGEILERERERERDTVLSQTYNKLNTMK